MSELIQKYVLERYADEKRLQSYKERTKNGFTQQEQIVAQTYLKGETILDVGCGTGREALALSKLGFKVTALDISPDMITLAKKMIHEKNIIFKNSNILEYHERKKFDNIIFFNNIFEQIHTEQDRKKSLEIAYDLLCPHGIFVLTTHSIFVPGTYGKDWISLLLRAIRFHTKKLLKIPQEETEAFDLILKKEKIYAHFSNPYKIKKILQQKGFSIITLYSGNSPLTPQKSFKYLFHEPVYYICTK